MTKYQT